MKKTLLTLVSLLTVCALLSGCASGTTVSTTTTGESDVDHACTTTATEPATTTAPTTTTTKATTTQPPVRKGTIDLTSGAKIAAVDGKEIDDAYKNAQLSFALDLFKQANKADDDNVMISPLSAQMALAIVANGASGDTLREIESTLGLTVEDINRYLYTYTAGLTSNEYSKIKVANSVWIKKGESVKQTYVNNIASYYQAQIYHCDFDKQTLKDMNDWVNTATDGLFDSMMEDIDSNSSLYLANTVAFDATWQYPFLKSKTKTGTFYAADGTAQPVQMMNSNYETNLLDDGKAKGFIKGYNGAYNFAVLLPNEEITLDEYISGLTAEGLKTTLANADRKAKVTAAVPKFSYDYDVDMEELLEVMGVKKLFTPEAELSGVSKKVYVDEAAHQTMICMNEDGTTAGAVSRYREIMGIAEETIVLDRPFMYLILDSTNDLPIFIGTVTEIGM